MTTTKSYSDRSRFFALYRTVLKQQIPFGIVAGILFLLIIPLPYFVDQLYRSGPPYFNAAEDLTTRWRHYFSAGVYLDEAQAILITLVLLVMGLIGALMQTSFLHSKKMTDLYHSIPIKRPQLLSAASLASVTAIFVPLLAVYLTTMIAQFVMYGQHLVGYGWYFQFIAIDLVAAIVTLIAVHAFTVFVSVHVGTVFDSFALTGVLGSMPLFVYGIVMAVWSSHTYGASSSGIESVFLWLSPFTFSFQRFMYIGDSIGTVEQGSIGAVLGVVRLLSIWLVIAAGFYAMAIVGYNRRKSELAEQTQPQGVFQMIGKCFAAFCGSALFYAIFYDSNHLLTQILASLFGSVLIGLVAELILSRGIRSLKKNLKWLAGAGALFCLVVFGARVDFIGYESRVPKAENVEAVSINYQGRFENLSNVYSFASYKDYQFSSYNTDKTVLTDPENIALVLEMHRLAVENKPREQSFYSYSSDADDQYSYNWTTIEYKLKNGGTMTRVYSTLFTEAYRILVQLEEKEEFIRQRHPIFFLDAGDGKVTAAELVDTITLYSTFDSVGKPYKPAREDTRRILEAVRRDMLGESLEEMTNPSQPPLGYMEIQFRSAQILGEGIGPEDYGSASVVISQEYQNTVEILRELGMWGDVDYELEVDEVRFYPAGYVGFTANRVWAMRPGNVPYVSSWRYDSREEDLPSIVDPAGIRQVLEKTRGQLLADDSGDVYIAMYRRNGAQLGGGLIRFEDLPETAKQQVMRMYRTEEIQMYGYPIFEAETAAVAAVAMTMEAPAAAVLVSVA